MRASYFNQGKARRVKLCLSRIAPSLGSLFAERFEEARQELGQAPRVGARDLPQLMGLNPNGTASVPIENLYVDRDGDPRDHRQGFSLRRQCGAGSRVRGNAQLAAIDHWLRSGADLPRHCWQIILRVETAGESPAYFPPPRKFVATLLGAGTDAGSVARIVTYARRPVYDRELRASRAWLQRGARRFWCTGSTLSLSCRARSTSISRFSNGCRHVSAHF